MSDVSDNDRALPAESSSDAQNPITQQSRSRGTQNTRRRGNRVITTNNQSYKGKCEDIGYILALRSEKFDRKVQFQVFLEKLGTYVVSKLKDGGDIQPLYSNLVDPNDNFTTKYKPTKPDYDTSGEIDEVDLEIYREEVKQFVQRKTNMRENI